jgi:hypothetical protein
MRAITAVILVTSSLMSFLQSSSHAQAPTGEYAFNIPNTNPEAFVAWRKILPQPLRSEPWIAKLEGTASPYTTITVNGTRHMYGAFCKSHECGMNRVAFLIAENGSRASGLYVKEIGSGEKELFFGNPTPEEIVLLRAMAR